MTDTDLVLKKTWFFLGYRIKQEKNQNGYAWYARKGRSARIYLGKKINSLVDIEEKIKSYEKRKGLRMNILINCSFNLNMIQEVEKVEEVRTTSTIVSKETFIKLMDEEKPDNYIGHASLIPIIKEELRIDLAESRGTLKVPKGKHQLLIIQYIGSRLPEGAKELPEGSKIIYVVESVEVK